MTEAAEAVQGLSEDPNLPGEDRDQLLALTVDRLCMGATLVTDTHFQNAMAEGFEALMGRPPTGEVKEGPLPG